MKKELFSLTLLMGIVTSLFSQNLSEKIGVEDLISDFDLLEFNLKNVHAGLHNYHSKKEFDSIFKTYKSQLDGNLTPLEFYVEIGPLIADIGDAHTEIEPPESFYDALNKKWPVFPISVTWLNNTLYVIQDFSDEKLTSLGDEISAINGIPAQEVFKNIRKYVPRDGNNLTSPNHTLSGVFGQFRNYYASIYGNPDSFQLEIVNDDGGLRTINIKGLKYKTIIDKYEAQKSPEKKGIVTKPLQLDIQEGIAILKVKSFHPGQIKDRGQNFKTFFKKSFKTISKLKIKKLIIDIRGNGGGHEVVFTELFSHITNKPFVAYSQLSTITNKIPNPELYLEKEEIMYLEKWGKKGLRPKGNIFLVTDEIGTQVLSPKKKTFNGEVFILIDGKSSSAAGDFTGLVDSFDRATFIGEETGGNPYVNTAGTRFTLVLPHSGLQIIIPTQLYIIDHKGTNDGHGMIPDYPVELTIDDVLNKRDKVLDFAIALAKK